MLACNRRPLSELYSQRSHDSTSLEPSLLPTPYTNYSASRATLFTVQCTMLSWRAIEGQLWFEGEPGMDAPITRGSATQALRGCCSVVILQIVQERMQSPPGLTLLPPTMPAATSYRVGHRSSVLPAGSDMLLTPNEHTWPTAEYSTPRSHSNRLNTPHCRAG